MAKIVLGYWKIRGLGQFIRLLLAYSGLEFEEVQYESQDKWFKEDKINLGFDFPNLPYLIDGDFKCTESAAVAKYVINRSGKNQLLGRNPEDIGKVDNIIGVIQDALKDIRGLFFNKDYEKVKVEQLEKVRAKFNYLRDFVGDKPFALGYLTLADFYLAENLYYFETLFPSEKKNYGFWWSVRKNFEALPEIKAYYARPDAMVLPFMPPFAALQPKLHNVKVGYWGIRGLAQVPRLLLSFAGVEFDNQMYTNGDNWFKDDKLNLGLHFPNLPYLVDDDYNISESAAIQRYIISKWGKPEWLGKNPQDNARIESFLAVFTEVSGAVKGLFFNKEFETAKAPLLEKYQDKLNQLNKFVGAKDWVIGYLTLADFIVAEDSHYLQTLWPVEYKTWPFLQVIREKFNKLPETVAYYEKESAVKAPFFPATAFLKVEQ